MPIVEQAVRSQEIDREMCAGCGRIVTPKVCWCGADEDDHVGRFHKFRPYMCECEMPTEVKRSR